LVGGGAEYSVAVEFRGSGSTFPTDPTLYWSPGGSPLEVAGSATKSQEGIPEEVQSQRVGCSAKRKVKSQKVHSQTTQDR